MGNILRRDEEVGSVTDFSYQTHLQREYENEAIITEICVYYDSINFVFNLDDNLTK